MHFQHCSMPNILTAGFVHLCIRIRFEGHFGSSEALLYNFNTCSLTQRHSEDQFHFGNYLNMGLAPVNLDYITIYVKSPYWLRMQAKILET